jgi:hypothetical protein
VEVGLGRGLLTGRAASATATALATSTRWS